MYFDCRPKEFRQEKGWKMNRDCGSKCKYYELCQKELQEMRRKERLAELIDNGGYRTRRESAVVF